MFKNRSTPNLPNFVKNHRFSLNLITLTAPNSFACAPRVSFSLNTPSIDLGNKTENFYSSTNQASRCRHHAIAIFSPRSDGALPSLPSPPEPDGECRDAPSQAMCLYSQSVHPPPLGPPLLLHVPRPQPQLILDLALGPRRPL
jgi:hypothetical protein